jgi:hypothetical protein
MQEDEVTVFERFRYRGFHRCSCVCRLEILKLPDGRPTHFKDPQWRAMRGQDWLELGLAPRTAVNYS